MKIWYIGFLLVVVVSVVVLSVLYGWLAWGVLVVLIAVVVWLRPLYTDIPNGCMFLYKVLGVVQRIPLLNWPGYVADKEGIVREEQFVLPEDRARMWRVGNKFLMPYWPFCVPYYVADLLAEKKEGIKEDRHDNDEGEAPEDDYLVNATWRALREPIVEKRAELLVPEPVIIAGQTLSTQSRIFSATGQFRIADLYNAVVSHDYRRFDIPVKAAMQWIANRSKAQEIDDQKFLMPRFKRAFLSPDDLWESLLEEARLQFYREHHNGTNEEVEDAAKCLLDQMIDYWEGKQNLPGEVTLNEFGVTTRGWQVSVQPPLEEMKLREQAQAWEMETRGRQVRAENTKTDGKAVAATLTEYKNAIGPLEPGAGKYAAVLAAAARSGLPSVLAAEQIMLGPQGVSTEYGTGNRRDTGGNDRQRTRRRNIRRDLSDHFVTEDDLGDVQARLDEIEAENEERETTE